MTSSINSQRSALRWFVLLAYALTWVLLAPWFYVFNVVYRGEMQSWMWAWVPLAFIGGWGPSVAALIVVGQAGGRSGVRRLIGSLTMWRAGLRWYLLAVAIPPLATAASLLLVDRGQQTIGQFNLTAALMNIPVAYALALPFGPIGEELGWRGFALPRLLSRFGLVKASLLLGGIWTFWHVPMMLWSPGASIPAFMGLSLSSVVIYLVQITALTALITFVFVYTNGSVLLAVIAHAAFNTAESVVFGGLPRLAPELVREVYLVNVALLAVLGLSTLGWLAVRPVSPVAA